eukprot:1126127-Lingulodinium_polyedra.AAC.1
MCGLAQRKYVSIGKTRVWTRRLSIFAVSQCAPVFRRRGVCCIFGCSPVWAGHPRFDATPGI